MSQDLGDTELHRRLTAEGIIVPTIPERPQQLSFDDIVA